jgi:glycolate oxidase iron-sulfur subunit
VFPNPWAMRQFSRMTSLMMFLRLNRFRENAWLPSALRQVLRYLPDSQSRFRSESIAQDVPSTGTRRFRVGLLSGCVMPNLFGETQVNTVKLLSQNGCDVHVPATAGCCGALLLHNGEKSRGLALARQTVQAFDGQELDAIITNAAGCGATMKEYAEHFKNDPELCDAGARVSGKVKDIAEFLAEIPDMEPKREIRGRVTYHDPCHLLNGQGVQKQPRDLVRKIPGLELVELAESDICCGSAGTYNLTQPDLARRLGERKAQHVVATGAGTLITGNPGCIIQIRAALRDRGSTVRVLHTADLLAQAYADAD